MLRHIVSCGWAKTALPMAAQPLTILPSGSTSGLPVTRILRDGNTVKFCLRTEDGYETESVIIPMGAEHTSTWRTLCVSSQIGCKRGCTFCQTAQMGLVRNLTADEIVAQARAARDSLGADIRNVVFMGMGEPLDNVENVIAAIELLHGDRLHPIARRRITVSTVGRTAGIHQLARLGWRRLGLAVSLNAPNDEIRSQIMPINRIEPMSTLRDAIAAYPVRAGGHVLIEYVLIEGLNDGLDHARQLADYLKGLRTCVNLIPWNPVDNVDFRTPPEDRVVAFQQELMSRGQLTFRRNTKGRIAMGACGQLGNPELRAQIRAAKTGS